MDSGAFRNTARDALLRRLGVQPVQTTQAFAPAATTGNYTPATTAFSPAVGSGPAGTGTQADDDAPDGKPCTRNGECGRNKACIDGFCRKPDKTLDGRQCTRSQDCPQGKKCENGNCVPKTDGGGGTPTGCNPACTGDTVCKDGACVPKDPNDPTTTCSTAADCGYGEECYNGTCRTQGGAQPGQVYSEIDIDPTKYLGNLARKATLQAEGGTAFGNFLAQRAFPNIQTAFEEEGLTDPNLKFKTWLARQQRYGNPDLDMVDQNDPGEAPDPAKGETCSKDNPGGTCNGPNRVCRNGVCKKRAQQNNDPDEGSGDTCQADKDCPAGQRCGKKNNKCKAVECDGQTPCAAGKSCVNGQCVNDDELTGTYAPDYENVQGFANYLRDLYYGASSTDRGQQNARFGQGATRWSAW